MRKNINLCYVLKPHYPLYDKKDKPLSIIHPFIVIIAFLISKPYNIFIIAPRIIPPTKK